MLLKREGRGHYSVDDGTGLPVMTVFLSERWVDENADPVAINATITVPNEADES